MTTTRPMRFDTGTDSGLAALIEMRNGLLLANKRAVFELVPDRVITDKQFSALHVWCQMVADTLNDAGLDQRIVLKPEVSIDWTKESVKRCLYKPLLKAMTGKTSTKDQLTVEPNLVANTMARHLGEKFGVTLPEWPKRRRAA